MALKTLDYRVTGPNGVNDPNIAQNVIAMAYKLAEKYDAFQDNPWPVIYKEIDAKFLGSKFILMLRESESWIKSVVEHFGRKETPMRKWIYGVGCPKGNEDIYVKRFEDHNNEVKSYFKDRPKDLLVMDLNKGDGWENLCPYVDADILGISFPHANKAIDRKKENAANILWAQRVKHLVNCIRRYT